MQRQHSAAVPTRADPPSAHLEYLNDTLLIVCDVNPFKHLAVLSPAQLADNLIAVLVPDEQDESTCINSLLRFLGMIPCVDPPLHSSPCPTLPPILVPCPSHPLAPLPLPAPGPTAPPTHSPPIYLVCLIVPVVPRLVCVHVCIHPRPAGCHPPSASPRHCASEPGLEALYGFNQDTLDDLSYRPSSDSERPVQYSTVTTTHL